MAGRLWILAAATLALLAPSASASGNGPYLIDVDAHDIEFGAQVAGHSVCAGDYDGVVYAGPCDSIPCLLDVGCSIYVGQIGRVNSPFLP
jgi:hypothetical protein